MRVLVLVGLAALLTGCASADRSQAEASRRAGSRAAVSRRGPRVLMAKVSAIDS